MSITPNFNFRTTTNSRANAVTQNKQADFKAAMNKAIAETKAKIPERVDKASQAHAWIATFSAGGKTYYVTIVPTYYEQKDGTFALTDNRISDSQPQYTISGPTELGPNEEVGVSYGSANIVYCFSLGQRTPNLIVEDQNGQKDGVKKAMLDQLKGTTPDPNLLARLRAQLASGKS